MAVVVEGIVTGASQKIFELLGCILANDALSINQRACSVEWPNFNLVLHWASSIGLLEGLTDNGLVVVAKYWVVSSNSSSFI